MAFFEKTLGREDIFAGRVFTVHRDTVELMDGRTSFREVVDHHGGVGIVAIDKEDNVLLVHQFRYPYAEELTEIPAGKLEKGEDPYDCAVRELSEETGCTAEKIVSLGKIYPTPGYCSEVLHIYLATGLTDGKAHLDEGEFLSVDRLPLSQAVEKALSGEWRDGKTVIGILRAAARLGVL